MDALIKESTIGPNEKLASLNEGMADERDTLYNIETYLDRPFEIDPCQEVELNETQREELNNQISQVNTSLSALEG